jgi:hypothetical protein
MELKTNYNASMSEVSLSSVIQYVKGCKYSVQKLSNPLNKVKPAGSQLQQNYFNI